MRNKLVQNTLLFYFFNIAKILFPLLLLPYLTRVLSVECYGVVAYVKAMMAYSQIWIDFGFMLSATKEIVDAGGDKQKIGQVLGRTMVAKLFLSFIGFIFLGVAVSSMDMLKQYSAYTVLSYANVVLSCFLFDFLFRGIEKMELLTVRFVLMKIVSTALIFLLVKGDEDLLWIGILEIFGTSVAILLTACTVRKYKIALQYGSIRDVMDALKISSRYFFSYVAATAFSALNTVLIGVMLPMSEVAAWSVAMQIIAGIQSLYGPLTNGIYTHMLRTRRMALLFKIFKIGMPIILGGCLGLYYMAEMVVAMISGTQYFQAVPLLRVLVPLLFFGFPAALLGWPALGAIGQVNGVLKSTLFAATFQIVGILLLIFAFSFTLENVAMLRCTTEAVLCLLRGVYCWKYKENFQ